MFSRLIFVSFLAIVCFVPSWVSAEVDTDTSETKKMPVNRPRIGLVLGGGGARGAAHIGVIRVLEEMQVPVDFIAGTSMGAVVGGFYASGLSPDEMEEVLAGLDWAEAFKDVPPRQKLSFRRKQDDRNFLMRFKLGFRDGHVRFPPGLTSGSNLNHIFRSLAVQWYDIQSFDKLRIPFRSVAANIVTGEEVVLSGGRLADAIRASMSVPGAIAPIEIDGQLLVDGGIVNNVPVDVAKNAGVDIVIAVEIASTPATKDDLTSAISVSGQVLTVMMENVTKRKLALLNGKDVFLSPNPSNSVSDFAKAKDAIETGYKSADAVRDQLAKLSVSNSEWNKFLSQQRRPPFEMPVIDRVEMDVDSVIGAKELETYTSIKPGMRPTQEQINADQERLAGLDIFEEVKVDLQKQGDENVLVYSVKDKSWGPTYLQAGINIRNNLSGDNKFNIGISATTVPINRYAAEWRTEIQVGDEMRAETEWYQPVGATSSFFIEPSLLYELQDVNLRSAGSFETIRSGELSNLGGSIDLGSVLGNWGELRIGYTLTYFQLDPDPGVTVAFDEGANANLGAVFSVDTFDNLNFPRDGAAALVEYRYGSDSIGSDLDYEFIQSKASYAKSWGRNTLLSSAQFDTAINEESDIGGIFYLGGFLQLSGFDEEGLLANHQAFGRLVGYREIGDPASNPLSTSIYLGGSFELGTLAETRGDLFDETVLAGSVFAGFDTAIGPLYLAYGFAETGQRSPYLILGQNF
ncbi:MAG: patatin-like phospholipase family protein [Bdellovibrionales bacterium]|nr:patatin-like phospholipase family protein [Bdellovibrionales bacterium]